MHEDGTINEEIWGYLSRIQLLPGVSIRVGGLLKQHFVYMQLNQNCNGGCAK